MPSLVEPRGTLSEADVWTVESSGTPTIVDLSRVADLGFGLRVFYSFSAPGWLFPVIRRIKHLLMLKANWDGYGALPIDPAAASFALRFLEATMPHNGCAPQVVPTVHGGLQLEWHREEGDIEVEIESQGNFVLFFESGCETQTLTGVAVAPSQATTLVRVVAETD